MTTIARATNDKGKRISLRDSDGRFEIVIDGVLAKVIEYDSKYLNERIMARIYSEQAFLSVCAVEKDHD